MLHRSLKKDRQVGNLRSVLPPRRIVKKESSSGNGTRRFASDRGSSLGASILEVDGDRPESSVFILWPLGYVFVGKFLSGHVPDVSKPSLFFFRDLQPVVKIPTSFTMYVYVWSDKTFLKEYVGPILVLWSIAAMNSGQVSSRWYTASLPCPRRNAWRRASPHWWSPQLAAF